MNRLTGATMALLILGATAPLSATGGQSLTELELACDTGDFAACDTLGNRLMGTNPDEAGKLRIAALFEKACNGGYLGGCGDLSVLYDLGYGVPLDEAKSHGLQLKACEGGHGLSCSGVGHDYLQGRGVEKDKAKAVPWFAKGCALDDKASCLSLGKSHEWGDGVPADKAKAREYYTKACNLGERSGCDALKWVQGE